MIRRLIILLLIVGCDKTVAPEPEDCSGVAGGIAYLDECGVCDSDSTNDCQFYDFFIASLSDQAIHGMQFEITGVTVLGIEPVSGFDIYGITSENRYIASFMSMQGHALPEHLIIIFSGSIENLCIKNIRLIDSQGNVIEIIDNCD